MRRSVIGVLAVVLMMSGGASLGAQKFPPDKFVNLQVFPKDTPPDAPKPPGE